MSVIYFEGTKKNGKVSYLKFRVRHNMVERNVEVPVDDEIARHVMAHIDNTVARIVNPVEKGNDEESV